MKLVLAEKPSVAQSIAKVLGAAKREDGYLEGNIHALFRTQATEEESEDIPLILIQFSVGYLSRSLWS